MDKQYFLEGLRQSLNGEVSPEVIEENVRYYDQYIGSKSPDEQAWILEELGNPRLIAKTIIETEKASHQKHGYHNNTSGYAHENEYGDDYDDNVTDNNHQHTRHESTNIYRKLTWWQKIIAALAILVVIIFLVLVGRVIIGFLFAFAVPILLILLVVALFKKRN